MGKVSTTSFFLQLEETDLDILLRHDFPKLKSRLNTLWTRSYYCESVGCISKETIRKYIENQKNA